MRVPVTSSEPDWMHLTVVAPPEVVHAAIEFLKREHGFVDIAPVDWCTLERRQDFARVDYAPHAPIEKNAYVLDWRDGPDPRGFDVDPGNRQV